MLGGSRQRQASFTWPSCVVYHVEREIPSRHRLHWPPLSFMEKESSTVHTEADERWCNHVLLIKPRLSGVFHGWFRAEITPCFMYNKKINKEIINMVFSNMRQLISLFKHISTLRNISNIYYQYWKIVFYFIGDGFLKCFFI